jgi:hypothetical protein
VKRVAPPGTFSIQEAAHTLGCHPYHVLRLIPAAASSSPPAAGSGAGSPRRASSATRPSGPAPAVRRDHGRTPADRADEALALVTVGRRKCGVSATVCCRIFAASGGGKGKIGCDRSENTWPATPRPRRLKGGTWEFAVRYSKFRMVLRRMPSSPKQSVRSPNGGRRSAMKKSGAPAGGASKAPGCDDAAVTAESLCGALGVLA